MPVTFSFHTNDRNFLSESIKNEDAKQMTIWQMKGSAERQREARYTKENGEIKNKEDRRMNKALL
jgi:hypothetical protein